MQKTIMCSFQGADCLPPGSWLSATGHQYKLHRQKPKQTQPKHRVKDDASRSAQHRLTLLLTKLTGPRWQGVQAGQSAPAFGVGNTPAVGDLSWLSQLVGLYLILFFKQCIAVYFRPAAP